MSFITRSQLSLKDCATESAIAEDVNLDSYVNLLLYSGVGGLLYSKLAFNQLRSVDARAVHIDGNV